MERYVLIRPGALGDALLALPSLALLRRERPGAHLTLVTRGDVLPLARASELADVTYDWTDAAWAALFASDSMCRTAGEVRTAVNGAHVVAWLADDDGGVARNLAAWGAWRVALARGRPAADDVKDGTTPREHMALLLARALASLGIAVPPDVAALAAGTPPLRADPHGARAATQVWQALDLPPGQRVMALHAGSGGAAKRWPPEHFAELARRLLAAGWRPLLVEGPADAGVTAALLAALGPPLADAVRVARGLELGTLAALLRRCAAYIGNDSGVSHLAALAGVPTLALFGPSDPARWAPLGRNVYIIRAPDGDLEALEVGAVWEALLGALILVPQS